jgi:hypothetical protein
MPLWSYAFERQQMPMSGVLPMNGDHQRVADSVLEDEPRSRLEPYREVILRWRRQGRSYRRICKLLGDKFDLKVGRTALHEFVWRRSRPRKVAPEPEIEQPTMLATEPAQAPMPVTKLTAEERAAQIEFIRSLNQPTLEEQPKQGWDFDLDKPRTIQKL